MGSCKQQERLRTECERNNLLSSQRFYVGVAFFLFFGALLSAPESTSSEKTISSGGVSNMSYVATYSYGNQSGLVRSARSRNGGEPMWKRQSQRRRNRRPEVAEPRTSDEEALEAAVMGTELNDDGDEYEEDFTTPAASSTGDTGGCSACRMREELKHVSLAAIKEQILSKLGISQAPNTTGRTLPKVPPVLLDKYRKSTHSAMQGMQGDEPVFKPGPVVHDEDDDYHARTDKVIAFAQPHPKLRHTGRGQDVLYFRFSEKIIRNKVLRAQLWVHVRGAGGGPGADPQGPLVSGAPVTINVLRVLRASDTPLTSHSAAIKVARQNDSEGSWVSLDVRRLVAEWFHYPRDNLGIIIQTVGLPDPLGRSLVVTDPEEGDGSLVPFLEVQIADGRRHRTKRTIGLNCHEKSEETRCCRYPLTVDFEEFGWDWIIAPKKYEANYCSGECPYVFLQKYPHTHIVHLASPGGTAGPCCAPRKLSPISMLYFDNEFNIIYGLLPGMVVDRCGCS